MTIKKNIILLTLLALQTTFATEPAHDPLLKQKNLIVQAQTVYNRIDLLFIRIDQLSKTNDMQAMHQIPYANGSHGPLTVLCRLAYQTPAEAVNETEAEQLIAFFDKLASSLEPVLNQAEKKKAVYSKQANRLLKDCVLGSIFYLFKNCFKDSVLHVVCDVAFCMTVIDGIFTLFNWRNE